MEELDVKNVKLVIFDVDGTLLNTEHIWLKAHEMVAEKYNCPFYGRPFVERITGLNGKEADELYKETFPDDDLRNKIFDDTYRLGQKLMETDIELMPGAKRLLDYYLKNKITMVICTNTNRKETLAHLKAAKVEDYFDFSVCGDEVINRKPNPEIYERVLRHYNIDAKDVLIYEDTSYGVKAAYNAGIKVIMCPSIRKANKEDYRFADKVVNSLEEINLD